MADVDTSLLSSQHSDIRREAAEHTNEIVREGMKGDFATVTAIKDSRHDVGDMVGSAADRLEQGLTAHNTAITSRFFDVGRDVADLRAQVVQAISEVRLSGEKTSQAGEIASLKTQIEGQKNTQYLSDKISNDGEKTRALINDLKYNDLNRALIERTTELVEERGFGRHWWGHGLQNQNAAQFAALSSQMQNFNSQLSETRQGMVNFGTMAGVGQTSSANNVR